VFIGDKKLAPYDGWFLSLHGNEECGDSRNDASWFALIHSAGWKGTIWRVVDEGAGVCRIEFAADAKNLQPYDGWLLCCHADEGSGDNRNRNSCFVIVHRPDGWKGGRWRLI